MKTKFKSKLLSILLVLVMVLALVPFASLTAFAASSVRVDFCLTNGALENNVFFENDSSKYFMSQQTKADGTLTSLEELYRTDSLDLEFDGWYTQEGEKVTLETVFTEYTILYDRWKETTLTDEDIISTLEINTPLLEVGKLAGTYDTNSITLTDNRLSVQNVSVYEGLNAYRTNKLEDSDVLEAGKSYSLRVELHTKNGELIDDQLTNHSTATYGLVANMVYSHDNSGIFTTKWTNRENKIQVIINYDFENYYFTSDLEDKVVENGQSPQYTVYVSNNANIQGMELFVKNANDTWASLGAVTGQFNIPANSNVVKQYRVEVTYQNGFVISSNTFKVDWYDPNAPKFITQPTDYNVANGTNVLVTWGLNCDVSAIYLEKFNGETYSQYQNATPTGTTVSALESGTYTFRVHATKDGGDIYSEEFTITWREAFEFTTQPQSITVATGESAVVAWETNLLQTSLQTLGAFQLQTDTGSGWHRSANLAENATSYNFGVSNFAYSQKYRLMANYDGTLYYSDEFTIEYIAGVFTSKPADEINAIVGKDCLVEWDFSLDVEYYDIKVYENHDFVPFATTDKPEYVFTASEVGEKQYFVQAYNSNDQLIGAEYADYLMFTIKWTEQQIVYLVSFNANGGTGTMQPVEQNAGSQYKLPDCTFTAPDGKKFKAWSVNDVEKNVGDTITVNANTVVKAVWEDNEVIYCYCTNGAEGSNEMGYATVGEEITLDDCTFTPPPGMKFKAWAIGSVNGEQKQPNEKITITEETYIYAIWEEIPHECIGVIESGQGATCTVDGWKDYYRCECGKYYEDENCTILISDLEAWKVGDGKIVAAHSGTPEWTKTATTHAKKYTCCDTFVVETEAHEWNNGVCSECEYVCLHTADTNKDHKCDACGSTVGTHEAALGKHTCDYCGKTVTECADGNKDHKCDTCGETIGTHVAASGKHTCDYCGKTASECADANDDGKCDICGANYGACVDSNKDHLCDKHGETMGTHEAALGKHTCDYCNKPVTECSDDNKDHKCDTCGEAMGTHVAASGKHTCDYCNKVVTECADGNKDHKCDTCSTAMGTHEAATGKHTCDYCGKTVTECADSDKNHKCDTCSSNMGTHEAASGKHTCDYCTEVVTQCVDSNKDHKCDICGAAMGTHVAASGKHTCDYCGKTVTECADTNSDGKCDTCGANYGECVDTNKDHKCDKHGEAMGTHEAALGKHTCDYCGQTVTECEDDNKDHKCDTCETAIGTHQAATGKHTCDYCGKTVTECADSNKDHKCDTCSTAMGTHEAADGKHTCDYCGKTVTDCTDSNKDHKCDTCSTAMGTHEAANGKHTCDYCGVAITECVDTNKDHKCDTCGASVGVHNAATGKHTCDYCGKTVTECTDSSEDDDSMCDICGKNIGDCVDANKDHKCDKHDENMGVHEAALGKHTCDYCGKTVTECADANKDHKCDTCDTTVGTHEAATGKHTCDYCGKTVTECADSNKDHKCDTCSTAMGTHEAANGKHSCDYCGKDVTECSDGNTDGKCDVCQKDLGTVHTHDYGTTWKNDANNHWNECSCGDKANVGTHADSDNNGKCDTCDYQMGNGGAPETPDEPKDGLSGGAIASIVVGSVVVLGLGGFALVWFVIKKKSFADLVAIFKKK